MLIYKTIITPNQVLSVAGVPIHLIGNPPYLIVEMNTTEDSYYRGYHFGRYISASNPCPLKAFFGSDIWTAYNQNWDKDLLVMYQGEIVVQKDWTLLMQFYDRRVADQVSNLLERLDWNKVKLEQQDQFYRGIRIAKIAPILGFRICMDCYNFDQFEFNWMNPAEYLRVINMVVGTVKMFI